MGEYGPAVDIFSFGVVMWEMWTREKPWREYTMNDEFNAMVRDKRRRLEIPRRDSDVEVPPGGYEKLMTSCWDHVKGSRPLIYMVRQDMSRMMEMLALDAAEARRLRKER